MRAEDARVQIVDTEAADGRVRSEVVKVPGFELGDLAPGGDLRWRDVFPVRAAVAGDPQEPFVGAGPEGVHVFEGRRQGVDDAALLRGRFVLRGHGADAGRDARLIAGEVRADGLPGVAAIQRLKDVVRGVVEDVGIDGREDDGLGAVGAVFRLPQGRGRDHLDLRGAPAELRDLAAAGAIDDIGIERVRRGVAVFDDADGMPLAEGERAVITAAGYADGTAFLLAAADLIGEVPGGGGVIELGCGLVVPGAPGPRAVDADRRALIADEQDDVGIIGVDPEVLVIVAAGRTLDAGPRFAGVGGAPGDGAGAVDDVGVFGVDADDGEVAATDAADGAGVGGDGGPGGAGVGAAIDLHAAGRGDGGIEASGVAGGDGDVGLAGVGGEAAGQFVPGAAAVGGFVESAVGAVVGVAEFPGRLAAFPESCVDGVGVGGVDGDVGSAGVFVDIEDFVPGDAAIGGAEDAAFGISAVGVSEDGCEEAVLIAGVDGEGGDLLAVAEAEVGPAFAGVDGFVDAVADREVGALEAFAAGDVDKVGIGGGDGDGADGLGGLVVEDGEPGAAVVVGFPDAAVDLAGVEDVGLGGDARCGAGAAAAEGTDVAPVEVVEEGGGQGLGGCVREEGEEEQEGAEEFGRHGCNYGAGGGFGRPQDCSVAA